MTLRIELSIVPFGAEDEKYVIETINVSNLGTTKMDTRYYNYIVEHNKYRSGEGLQIIHKRAEGALELARLALTELLEANGQLT